MTCSDAKRVLPEIMDGGENVEFQSHLKSCPTCTELVTELELIASEARQLAESNEPPQRLWVKLAAELRAEGIIREPETARPAALVPASTRRWRTWWLAPVAAALIVGASYYATHRPEQPQVANQSSPATAVQPSVTASTEKPVEQKRAQASGTQVVAKNDRKSVDRAVDAANVPTMLVGDDVQFLSGVSRQPAQMRATFETQLKSVNAYIRDAEEYVRQNPDDEDAKQQLMDAYEQKAMLYQMALDQVQ